MSANGHVVEITDASFAAEIGGEGITVVDFWAPWCGPCRFVAPILDELAGEYAGRVRFGKLNVDENPETAARFGIASIPTIGFFRAGEALGGVVGAVPKQVLQEVLEKELAA